MVTSSTSSVAGMSQLTAFCCWVSMRRTSASWRLMSGSVVWRANWCQNHTVYISVPFLAMSRQRV